MPRGVASFVLVAILEALAAAQSPVPPKALTLIVRPMGQTPAYRLEGDAIPKGQLLTMLANRYRQTGASVRLNILVHQDVALTQIFRVQATVGKVGFTNSRIFCFDRDKGAMWELSFGREVPFTTKP
jgi:hypothetical protein